MLTYHFIPLSNPVNPEIRYYPLIISALHTQKSFRIAHFVLIFKSKSILSRLSVCKDSTNRTQYKMKKHFFSFLLLRCSRSSRLPRHDHPPVVFVPVHTPGIVCRTSTPLVLVQRLRSASIFINHRKSSPLRDIFVFSIFGRFAIFVNLHIPARPISTVGCGASVWRQKLRPYKAAHHPPMNVVSERHYNAERSYLRSP